MRELAADEHLPVPRIYMIPEDTPTAFATGRNPENAVVAVTAGITRILTPAEIKGVLAHELGHVKNRDILVSSIAATLAGAVMILASTTILKPILKPQFNTCQPHNPQFPCN